MAWLVRKLFTTPMMKTLSGITPCTTRSIQTTAASQHPDPFQYDNQVFYDGVRFGYKRTRANVRNQHLKSDFFQKRAGLQKLSRVRIVDNSKWANLARRSKRNVVVIQVYNRLQIANVGDMVLVTVGGHMKKALVVGQRQLCGVNKTRSDSSNVIILNEGGSPEGTRITVPIPAWLRGYKPTFRRPIDMSKVIAIATSFV